MARGFRLLADRRRAGVGLLALAAVLFLTGVAGCRPAHPPRAKAHASEPSAALVDDLGRPWEGRLPARRVISLAPNVTEIVCAVAGVERLAGVDTASDYPPQVRRVRRVGDFLRPNVESIVALRADAVILSSGTIGRADAAEFSARFRTPVFVVSPRRLADVTRNIRVLSQLLGVPSKGEALASEMERRFDVIRRAVAGRPRRTVFLEVWHEPLTTVGPRTVLDDLIRVCGGRNVAASQPKEFPTFSLESLLAADPEVYIVTAHAGRLLGPDPARRFGFGTLRAVRNRRVCRVPADPLLRPAPRLVEGAAHLARAIHPEAFR